MKEVEKKDTPEVSGGYVGPLVSDPPATEDYPQFPTIPVQPEPGDVTQY